MLPTMGESGRRTILVVDDEQAVREALKSILGREGYSVITAEDGARALQLLGEDAVDLIISDQNMPGMSGIDLLKLVRVRHPRVMRVMLTAEPDPQLPVRSINEGEVYRFIRKPWSNSDLRTIIELAFQVLRLEEEKRRLISLVRKQRTAWEQGKSPADPVGLEAELLALAEDEIGDT